MNAIVVRILKSEYCKGPFCFLKHLPLGGGKVALCKSDLQKCTNSVQRTLGVSSYYTLNC